MGATVKEEEDARIVESPRVFVTNFAGHDYTTAEPYGEIVWITKGYVSFHSLDRVKFKVAETVVKSRANDYLCLSGTPLISLIAGVIWFHLHRRVRLLVWDKKGEGSYREMLITEKNLSDLVNALTSNDG